MKFPQYGLANRFVVSDVSQYLDCICSLCEQSSGAPKFEMQLFKKSLMIRMVLCRLIPFWWALEIWSWTSFEHGLFIQGTSIYGEGSAVMNRALFSYIRRKRLWKAWSIFLTNKIHEIFGSEVRGHLWFRQNLQFFCHRGWGSVISGLCVSMSSRNKYSFFCFSPIRSFCVIVHLRVKAHEGSESEFPERKPVKSNDWQWLDLTPLPNNNKS